MRSVSMLIASNLRRHRGTAVSFALISLIAALLLNLGLLSLTELPRIFEKKISELHTPYVCTVISDAAGSSQQLKIKKFISDYSGVAEVQRESVLFFPTASFTLKSGGSYSNTVIAESADAAGSMEKLSFVGGRAPVTDASIYVPYILQAKGYRLGDSFAITSSGKAYRFVIAGFTEDMLLGSLQTGGIRFYMPAGAYRHFTRQLGGPGTQAVMYSARTASIDMSSELYDAVNQQISLQSKSAMQTGTYSIDISRLAVSMPIDIGAAMEIAFALVVALVLLLVIRFRIVNSIEEDMQNIGALEAVGYTSRQVRLAFILQFLLTAFAGAFAGVLLSYAVAIPHGRLLTAETGMNWTQGFDLPVSLLSLVILLSCVAVVTIASTRRIRRLPVIVALRGGISTHSFRRNHLPLAYAHGPLNLLLSLKMMLSNVRQNVALALILAAVSFASIFVFLLFYNFGVDNTAVMHVMGGEPDDIVIGAQSADAAGQLIKALPRLPHVTQAVDYGYATIKADGKAGYGRITTDYGKMKNDQTYEGRFPKHDNEAAIGGRLAAELHKSVGDSIRISAGGESREYMITGFTQSASDIGKGIYLTTAGMQRISTTYRPVIVFVYIDKKADIDTVMHTINSCYGSQIDNIANDRDTMQSTIGTYAAVVAAFATVVFAVMGLIVVLILMLITGAMLVRRKHELGIEKAIGFTTWQLMRQISLSSLSAALSGSLLGGILGWYGSDPLMSCMFKSMGIMKTEFILPPASVPAVCAFIAMLTYLFTMLSAAGIRRISPCALVNE